jgi:hypothetical protein
LSLENWGDVEEYHFAFYLDTFNSSYEVMQYEEDDMTPKLYIQKASNLQQLEVYLDIDKPGYPLTVLEVEVSSKKRQEQNHQRASRDVEEVNLEWKTVHVDFYGSPDEARV